MITVPHTIVGHTPLLPPLSEGARGEQRNCRQRQQQQQVKTGVPHCVCCPRSQREGDVMEGVMFVMEGVIGS